MRKALRLLRHDWPVHFLLMLLNWLPDNTIFLWVRGVVVGRFLGSCGPNLRLGRNVTFYNPSLIHFGRDVYVAYGCWFMAGERILISDEVMFGPYCVISSSSYTRQSRSFRFSESECKPIKIGSGTWLAAHVVATSGSIIGDGALIGAGAIVRGSIPSNVLAAGQPARVIKQLKDSDGNG